MRQVNANLKTELLGLIDQMETQLLRMNQVRAQRHQQKKAAMRMNDANKNRLYMENTNKIMKLKKEIDRMYFELELQYNNNGLIELENKLKED